MTDCTNAYLETQSIALYAAHPTGFAAVYHDLSAYTDIDDALYDAVNTDPNEGNGVNPSVVLAMVGCDETLVLLFSLNTEGVVGDYTGDPWNLYVGLYTWDGTTLSFVSSYPGYLPVFRGTVRRLRYDTAVRTKL